MPDLVRAAVVLLGLTAGACQAPGPKLLAREPEAGQLQGGEKVFVDDRTCPSGQVKQVIGGTNTFVSSGISIKGTGRSVSCVDRASVTP